MEDHNQSRKKSKSEDKESVLELSKDMESPDQTKHKIIDLTLEVDSSEDTAKPQPTKEMIQENISDTPEPAENKSPGAMVNGTADSVEDEVDAAFETAQMQPIESTEAKAEDQLLDELSDIPQQVDDALSQFDENSSPDENPLPPAEPALLDNDELAAGAAELEAAMAGYDNDNFGDQTDQTLKEEDELSDTYNAGDGDDIIELADRVEAAEMAASSAITPQEDDEIIELTDIQNDEIIELTDIEDDEIIDLTDIVDPAEAQSLGLAEAEETAGPPDAGESPIAPDPSGDAETTNAGPDPIEEALTFSESEIDGDVDFSADIDAELATEQDAIGDPDKPVDMADLDTLFDGDDIAQEEPRLAMEPQLDDIDTDIAPGPRDESEHHEQVIQLTDVLSAPDESSSPATEFHAGGQEDRIQQPLWEESKATSGPLDSSLDRALGIENGSEEDQKIKAAVEHVIQTKYADTIEQLIANEVEKAVTREIESIKRTLSGEGDLLKEP
jgi:hypothetical protein